MVFPALAVVPLLAVSVRWVFLLHLLGQASQGGVESEEDQFLLSANHKHHLRSLGNQGTLLHGQTSYVL